MNTLAGDTKKALESEFLQCLAGGMDSQRMDDFLDQLIRRVGELGTITCTLVDDSRLRVQAGDQPFHEVTLPRARTKIRTLCARLAARCCAWSGRDVSPYGDEVEFKSPFTKRLCKVRFENTTASVKLAFEDPR